jgi:hypothetical protein
MTSFFNILVIIRKIFFYFIGFKKPENFLIISRTRKKGQCMIFRKTKSKIWFIAHSLFCLYLSLEIKLFYND